MEKTLKRIAINFGGGYVPGLNSVIAGVVLAADKMGWEVMGIRDGYDGLLFSERYPDGGLLKLTPELMEDIAGSGGCILGTAAQTDPFHVRVVNDDDMADEVDRSDELIETIRKEKIDAVISVVGQRALSILWKLSRKGLTTICIPKSVENDVAETMLSFGFNSALSFVTEMLERVHQAARSARKIGIVEVLGEHAGWLALQSGMAVGADAVLIPEVPFDIRKVAERLTEKAKKGRNSGLVVVAEGAKPATGLNVAASGEDMEMKAALSPGAAGNSSLHVIEKSGQVSKEVTADIQRLTNQETFTIVIGQLARGGVPTVVDRQLGLGYGAGAVRALSEGKNGVMVVFQPPELKYVPLSEAINKYRTIPADSGFIHLANSLNISLGE